MLFFRAVKFNLTHIFFHHYGCIWYVFINISVTHSSTVILDKSHYYGQMNVTLLTQAKTMRALWGCWKTTIFYWSLNLWTMNIIHVLCLFFLWCYFILFKGNYILFIIIPAGIHLGADRIPTEILLVFSLVIIVQGFLRNPFRDYFFKDYLFDTSRKFWNFFSYFC